MNCLAKNRHSAIGTIFKPTSLFSKSAIHVCAIPFQYLLKTVRSISNSNEARKAAQRLKSPGLPTPTFISFVSGWFLSQAVDCHQFCLFTQSGKTLIIITSGQCYERLFPVNTNLCIYKYPFDTFYSYTQEALPKNYSRRCNVIQQICILTKYILISFVAVCTRFCKIGPYLQVYNYRVLYF